MITADGDRAVRAVEAEKLHPADRRLVSIDERIVRRPLDVNRLVCSEHRSGLQPGFDLGVHDSRANLLRNGLACVYGHVLLHSFRMRRLKRFLKQFRWGTSDFRFCRSFPTAPYTRSGTG